MNNIQFFTTYIREFVKTIFDINTAHINFSIINKEIIFYIKLTISAYNTCLLLTLIMLFVNFIVNLFFKNTHYITKVIKYVNISVITIILTI